MTGHALAMVIGFICGFIFMGSATDYLMERRIKAGGFETGGTVYIIKPLNGE